MAVKKRILVISDTHGRFRYLDRLREEIGPVDSIIHLGDIARDEIYIQALFGCPVDMVLGNNDYYSDLPAEYITQVGKHKVLLTHGHAYSVYYGTDRLIRRAREAGADTVMFGHTHSPMIDAKEGITVINPGSISQPRQPGGAHTYVMLEVDETGEFCANVREIT